ncbi:MAG: SH3 domain-containing protein [Spirochaetes bacterium]|nr:SH3 domain-containing protein [Spirochaetota bacterium]
MRLKFMFHLILLGILCLSAVSAGQENDIYSKDWVIVCGDQVNVRKEPDLKSGIIAKLNAGSFVYVKDEKGVDAFINGVAGRWINVNCLDGKNTSGWIFDKYLACKSDFKKIEKWQYDPVYNFESEDDDWGYVISTDGSFVLKKVRYDGLCSNIENEMKLYGGYQKKEDDKNKRNCVFYADGHMYVNRNIIRAKLPGMKYGGNDFFILKNNKLHFLQNGVVSEPVELLITGQWLIKIKSKRRSENDHR